MSTQTEYDSIAKKGAVLGQDGKHYPNKTESAELRRLMKKSGETKEQVLAKKENRRLLAAAQKAPAKSPDKAARSRKKIMDARKEIAKNMGLPVYDTAVEKETCRRFGLSVIGLQQIIHNQG